MRLRRLEAFFGEDRVQKLCESRLGAVSMGKTEVGWQTGDMAGGVDAARMLAQYGWEGQAWNYSVE